jgi:hypothetical protein
MIFNASQASLEVVAFGLLANLFNGFIAQLHKIPGKIT